MTKRIFRSICTVALGVFITSGILFLFVLYNYFGDVQKKELRMQTELAAHAAANEGTDFFDGLDAGQYRITWIDPEGDVIYDNRSDTNGMENHLEREEIKQALESGQGESTRYSDTLMQRSLYCAKRLPDGSVLRLSVSHSTLLTLILGMALPVLVIIVIAVCLSLFLARNLSTKIMEPLNSLDLENPLSDDRYDEMSPLLHRLDSQQKQIRLQEAELARKQKEFEAVTENMTEGIILLNTQGNVIGINRAAKRLFGVTAPCIGENIRSLSDSPEIEGLLQSIENGRSDECTTELADGCYQLILSPVRNRELISGSVLLAINVTERERIQQMRQEFTANVSHELKTPLHSISGSAELLVNGVVAEDDKMTFYKRIYSEAQRMIRLVDDIIRISHLDEGMNDSQPEKTDLFAIAGETVNSLQPEADNAHVSLTLEGEPAFINGIPQLLRSIVFNLCDNAIKYNREYGSVSVSVRNESSGVVLSVSDTGIGIPPKYQERVFERFYRVDKSRSKELGGTGLGLSIVKHAAKIHHAQTDLQSVENGGTTITLTFPYGTENNEQA